MFPSARGTGKQTVSRFDPFDQPFIAASQTNPDTVAGSDDTAFFGSERFQQTSHGTAKVPAIGGLHVTVQPMDAQYTTRQTNGFIHGRHFGSFLAVWNSARRIVLNDGAFT